MKNFQRLPMLSGNGNHDDLFIFLDFVRSLEEPGTLHQEKMGYRKKN